jgi:hypothetical protein
MLAPPAELIEIAADELREDELDEAIRIQQLKELHTASGRDCEDFEKGYELGLQTARVWLRGNLAAVQAKVEL